ncbi:MAG: hypothetical protein JWN24_1663 [Phycisphaerales bacterium]|nr:hypothetical protein [Phycisphaerales bacterium]
MFSKKAAFAAICAVASLGVSALVARADTITSSVKLSGGSYQYSDGGEFAMHFVTNTVPDLKDQQVFCVEIKEDISFGTTYYGALSEQIKYNAGLFSAINQPPATNLAEIQYLFYQFSTGNLANYTASGSQRQLDAGALQWAIWDLAGENPGNPNPGFNLANLEASQVGLGTKATGFEAAAALAVAGGWTNNQSLGTVKILNLYTGVDGNGQGTGSAQDQLVLVSTPLPSTAAAGCGMLAGLAVLVMARKKRVLGA